MNFVTGGVPDAFIQQAIEIRKDRDRRYRNIYKEEVSDLRWVGEIGEICFDKWLKINTTLPVKWITEDVAGSADFLIGDTSVGMKTVKRKGPVGPGFTAQITARHAEEPVDHFFFASYIYPRKELQLLGGITRADFLGAAIYHGAGSRVHSHYTVRKGHEIYNIEIEELTPPLKWISSLG
ncbi:hypothetical protein [Saccharothrix yanglingensis]|uniref:hypothetical protein n=1 Tax=Saccharothrix yanglingensis TaxID=659496 RepID=UPI0027D200EA|nr:hypothetical protein [Saccharothrix yanglingensis]